MADKKDTAASAAAADEAPHAAPPPPPPRRLKYNKPLIIFLPTVIAFVLLNYLVASTETDETGKWRILPEYVTEAAEERDNALRDHEEPAVDYRLSFEEKVMGSLFRLGCRWFGSLQGIQLVLAVAWIIHMFELGVCVRTCRACNASTLVTLRYSFCTIMSGFAQLVPLFRAKREYLAETTGKNNAGTAKKANDAAGAADKKRK